MKTLFSISILLFFLFACSEDSNLLSPFESNTYRQIAYNSLNDSQKQILTDDWLVAPVVSGKNHNEQYVNRFIINSNKSFTFALFDRNMVIKENKSLVSVSFKTKYPITLGSTILIIDRDSKTVIGFVPVN